MDGNTRKTSTKIGSLASKVLRDPNASSEEKSLAASALSQSSKSNRATSKEIETKASKIFRDHTATEEARSLAASIISQSNKINT